MNQQLKKNYQDFFRSNMEINEYNQIMGMVTGGKGREGAFPH